MTIEALEGLISERRRQAEEKEFRKKAYALTSGWTRDLSRSIRDGVRCAGCEHLEIETVNFAYAGGVTSSTRIRFKGQLVFEERDFTTTRYMPGDEWEAVFNFLVVHNATQGAYEFEDPRDAPPLIDDQIIEASLKRIWGL